MQVVVYRCLRITPHFFDVCAGPLQLRAIERIIQFPFVLSAADKCTEEEIARAAEKRREQVKSCKKWQAKARLEKVLSLNLPLLFSRL